VLETTREAILRRILAGKVDVAEAALLLGLSERQVWRLKARFLAGRTLAHGNRGRAPANRVDPALAARVVALAKERYAGINDSHLTELLASREGIQLSRPSVQRILRGAGLASPRRHRRAKYRARRERRAAAGMLVQFDGSPHHWFGRTRPRASLLGAIDDATGDVVGAIFREQEDAAGYFAVLGQLLEAHGVPLAAYTDKHSIFVGVPRRRESIEEELAGQRQPTQLGRAFAELDVELILAHSPQAKGRVERLWETFQDRLVAELRLAGITPDIAGANAFLPGYLERHNARFAVAAADPEPAWRPLPEGKTVESVCCFKYSRLVAADNTVRLDGQRLQLPPRSTHWSWAGQRVEVRQHLDGSWSVYAPGGHELARSAAPKTTPTLRAKPYARAPISGVQPLRRGANSPWRKGYTNWHPAAAARTLRATRGRSA